ncbi:MAG: E3 binding domain-containing protein [Sphingopyxis sp.]|nr:E3 binding domain-containing protein [Sphingopyxis sp.]
MAGAAGMLLMPKLGLTMTEGEVSQWLCAAGARFAKGDTLVVIETDKIAHEVEAPASGVIDEILAPEGQTVAVSLPLARWTLDGVSPSGNAGEDGEAPAPAAPQSPAPAFLPPPEPRVVATPLARRTAAAAGIDLARVTGSGPKGRIKAADVERFASDSPATVSPAPAPQAPASEPVRGVPDPALPGQAPTGHLAAIPQLHAIAEVEISKLLEMQARMQSVRGLEALELVSLLVLAVVRSIEAHPASNRIWTPEGAVAIPRIDIGLLSGAGHGDAILRDLGGRGLGAVSAAIAALPDRESWGPSGQADPSAITLQHALGSAADILHMPVVAGQAAILSFGGEHSLFRPDDEGLPALRHELRVGLSADARLFDVALADLFLASITRFLEDPLVLLAT